MTKSLALPALAAVLLLGAAGCQTVDRTAGVNTSGRYPGQSDGTPANPPGTTATRALDRAAGTDVSGAYPAQRDGTPANPRGTAATRTFDRATGNNTSGNYPSAPVRAY